jgi:hypothetical protein
MSNNVSTSVKNKIIGDYIKTAAGRQKLAASMTQPLRTRRDYSSVGRKTFLVEQLPDGALPIYDKDPDVTAYVVGEEGQNILAITKPRRVIFPLFEIASNPEIPLTQIKERRFDLIERAQELARAQIQAAEDERVFAVLDAIASQGFDSLGAENELSNYTATAALTGTPAAYSTSVGAGLVETATNGAKGLKVVAPITGAVLADAFALVERHDLRVARVFMNARDYADVRKFNRDILDIESQASLLRTGLQATIWGAQIICSRLVPPGSIYVCCEPEMFGRIPVRTDLTVLSADDPKSRTIGFSVFEQLGIGAYNPRGLVKIEVTRP